MASWKYRLIAGAKLIGLLVFARVFFSLLVHPTWSLVVLWGTILIGCAWFIWTISSRWYPTLKKRFGLPRVYKILGVLNALAWLPGFWIARYALNSITGVDAGNFPTALWVFTLGGIAYVWLTLIMLSIGVTSLKSIVMFLILWVWGEIRSFFWSLTLSVPQLQPLPIGRHLGDMLAAMCALGLLGMVIENATIRHAGKAVANFVLVATEFSYDKTCDVSSQMRWVAPLKDRRDLEATKVMIADVQSFTHIQFTIGQCK